VIVELIHKQDAMEIACVIFERMIQYFGQPSTLLSDNGTEFRNDLIKRLNAMMGTRATWTSLYHPQTDGLVERFNRTLIEALRTLKVDRNAPWETTTRLIQLAYNSTQDSLGSSPYFLMFGHEPLIFGSSHP
jgi:transposase InsO family protein